ncbi:cytochrome c biogenesis protein CcsA [Desulfobulbus sp. TB]|nr:cytochrome c biogenesis protein CcsA [Desulfobulbus sp. TB]
MMNSSQLFGYTTIIYLLSAAFYIGLLVFRHKKIGLVGLILASVGVLIHTGVLGLRWHESYQIGLDHAPLTNMYESLVFFAWCITLFYILLELKFKVSVLGAFVMPLAVTTMAYASLSVKISQDINPLVPALQSNWLLAHVITCFIGYGAFAVAGGLGIMYLLRGRYDGHTSYQLLFSFKGRTRRWIYSWGVVAQNLIVTTLVLCSWVVYSQFLVITPEQQLTKNIILIGCILAALIFQWSLVPLSIKRAKDLNINQRWNILLPVLLVLIHTVLIFQVAPVPPAVKEMKDFITSWPWIFIPPFGVITLLLFLFFRPGTQQSNDFGLPPKDTPEPELGNILKSLPSQAVLDDLTHRTIIFGFMWLTAGIITGAVWANEAWGTYWSWDPKETWSIITWFVYALALHARFTRGWSGPRIAWLAIIGFFSVFFTYFGVNFLLIGLHSYGAS